jgi:hypothetical protein
MITRLNFRRSKLTEDQILLFIEDQNYYTNFKMIENPFLQKIKTITKFGSRLKVPLEKIERIFTLDLLNVLVATKFCRRLKSFLAFNLLNKVKNGNLFRISNFNILYNLSFDLLPNFVMVYIFCKKIVLIFWNSTFWNLIFWNSIFWNSTFWNLIFWNSIFWPPLK